MHIDGRDFGEPPFTLLDYFPDDFLLVIDESHQAVPQLHGQYEGDRSRKDMLVEHGFRLPSARDNRPLTFDEVLERINQCVFMSATPSAYELRVSDQVVEQIVRPTGLVDPEVVVKPTKGQIDDLIESVNERVTKGDRVLVTTLTKKMAEDLTDYLLEQGLRVRYLHSNIDTIQRIEILRALRLGEFDVLVGINLLREGLDLPEVSLVAILDADKEGFLRSETSLVQTIGRAARNIDGQVVMYADKVTDSMRRAIDLTNRRREAADRLQRRARHQPADDPQGGRRHPLAAAARLRVAGAGQGPSPPARAGQGPARPQDAAPAGDGSAHPDAGGGDARGLGRAALRVRRPPARRGRRPPPRAARRRMTARARLALVVGLALAVAAGCDGDDTASTATSAVGSTSGTAAPANPELRAELLAMMAEDQAEQTGAVATDGYARREARIAEILDEFGWPTADLVGADGSTAAWVIVQHADLDPALQARALELMRPAVEAGQASPGDLAYLQDRVDVAAGRDQQFGTQIRCGDDGVPVPATPIADEAGVEQRRAAAGLDPLEDYLAEMTEMCAATG